jgi:hypothetical protein
MPEFRTIKEMNTYIEKTYLIQFLTKIGDEVKSVLKNFILQDLYSAYTPTEYTRTMDFLNAVECKPVRKVGNSYEVEVFINPEKFGTDSDIEDGGWLHHTSSLGQYRGDTEYGGKSIAEWLIYWFETSDNSSPYSRKGIGMFENTRQWIKQDDYIRVRLKELFENKGITCL